SLKQRSHAGIRAQFFVHSAASSRIPFGRSFSESDWILFPHAGAKSLFLHCAGTKRLEWLIFSENLLPHPENRKPLHRTAVRQTNLAIAAGPPQMQTGSPHKEPLLASAANNLTRV